ncbi:uncharacterized protein RAG0_03550 [Rhynchosporium agropyri]|uniref:Uncharacterized protein n=2 Tax=Rhynchosporium TaxID=38037 RepID=A0A1E1MI50_RHYSE|nr:uncharacterized protein RAG0_03550 [Rhynchosporium agropyri]CZT48791.1 uncharacterized protein RSE6_09543 [Rhynchosporium secalis]
MIRRLDELARHRYIPKDHGYKYVWLIASPYPIILRTRSLWYLDYRYWGYYAFTADSVSELVSYDSY